MPAARRSAGKVSSRMACETGWRPPPAIPWTIRQRISIGRLVARPQSAEVRVKMATQPM